MEDKEEVEEVPQDLSQFVPITHDMFFFDVFGDPEIAQALLKNTLKPEAVKLLDLENLQIQQTKFLTNDFQERRADMIYQLPLKHSEKPTHFRHFYVLLEHKAKNDRWAIFQTTQYIAELERKIVMAASKGKDLPIDFLIPTIVAMIICHGETPHAGPKRTDGLREPFVGYEEDGISINAIWIDLSETLDEELPNDPDEPRLNMSMRMMKYILRKNFKQKFLEIMLELQPYLSIPKYQRFRSLILYYAFCRAKYFTREDLLDIIKQVPNPTQENEEMSLMEQLKAEGRVEGRVEGKADSVILLLSSMGHVPQELVERIQEEDASRLDDLLLLAKKCDSVEEFEKAL